MAELIVIVFIILMLLGMLSKRHPKYAGHKPYRRHPHPRSEYYPFI